MVRTATRGFLDMVFVCVEALQEFADVTSPPPLPGKAGEESIPSVLVDEEQA